MQYSFIKSPGKANKQKGFKHEGFKQEGLKQEGFTIIELLIVIVVIGILAAITVVAYTGIQSRATSATLRSNLTQDAKKLDIAKINSPASLYPATLAEADLPDTTGLTYTASTAAPATYCLTATSTGSTPTSVHIGTAGTPTEGPCPGHPGTQVPDLNCPTGYITIPGSSLFGTNAFCAMKYEAKNVGGVATSQAAGTPWVSISQTNAITTSAAACDSCHLISEAEYLTIAHNVISVPSNWSGGTVGSGYIYSGHNDASSNSALAASTNDGDGYSGTGNVSPSNQRRTLTLTNGEVIWDIAGNVWEWTSGQTNGGQPGASGLAWRQWNAIAGTGSLSPNPHPSYGTPAASNWTSGHGIGQTHSSSTDASLRGFRRGGAWDDGSNAGVLTLILNASPSTAYSLLGFRVAR